MARPAGKLQAMRHAMTTLLSIIHEVLTFHMAINNVQTRISVFSSNSIHRYAPIMSSSSYDDPKLPSIDHMAN